MDGSPHPTEEQDPTDKADYNKKDFLDQTRAVTETETLPTSTDDAGFDTERNITQYPTKTFGDNGTKPVTNEALSHTRTAFNPIQQGLQQMPGMPGAPTTPAPPGGGNLMGAEGVGGNIGQPGQAGQPQGQDINPGAAGAMQQVPGMGNVTGGPGFMPAKPSPGLQGPSEQDPQKVLQQMQQQNPGMGMMMGSKTQWVQKRGNKYVMLQKDTGNVISEHDSEEEARRYAHSTDPDKNPIRELIEEYEGYLMPNQVEAAIRDWKVE
jgi:hypothetical protein